MLIIHDLTPEEAGKFDFGENRVISDNGKIRPCIGCFGCWLKTPGKCVLCDGYEAMGKAFSECDRLMIISKCTYGSYSPFVKNVLDRSIGYISPFFEIRNGEMHHQRRYNNHIKITVYMYGEDITGEERKIAERLVEANALNIYAEVEIVAFFKNPEEIRGEQIC